MIDIIYHILGICQDSTNHYDLMDILNAYNLGDVRDMLFICKRRLFNIMLMIFKI